MRSIMDLTYLSITEASDLLHKGELSPVELTRACLERIEQLDGRLHSFITLMAITAMQQARQAEVDLRKGKTGSPWHPISHQRFIRNCRGAHYGRVEVLC